MRPHNSPILLILDAISLVFLLAAVALFIVIAFYNAKGCFNCSDLDFNGSIGYAIVALLFISMVFPILGLFGVSVAKLLAPQQPAVAEPSVAYPYANASKFNETNQNFLRNTLQENLCAN